MKKPLLTIDFNFGDHLPESMKPILPLALAQIRAGLETMKPIHVAILAALVGDETFRVTVEELEPAEAPVEGVFPPDDVPEDMGVECVRCGHGQSFHARTGSCDADVAFNEPCQCDRFEALA